MPSFSASASRRRARAALLALVTGLLTAMIVLLAPAPASAHDTMIDSAPAADSTVEAMPEEIVLTFNATLIDGATEIRVTGPSGQVVSEGAATVTGSSVSQPLSADAEDGVYTVLWHVVSSDGHPTDGQFAFTLAGGSADAPEEPSAEPTVEPAPAPAQTVTATPEASAESPGGAAPSAASAWIWAISIAGVLAAVGLAVWLAVRRRSDRSAAHSDGPSAR